jgi:hypothetical protein
LGEALGQLGLTRVKFFSRASPAVPVPATFRKSFRVNRSLNSSSARNRHIIYRVDAPTASRFFVA